MNFFHITLINQKILSTISTKNLILTIIIRLRDQYFFQFLPLLFDQEESKHRTRIFESKSSNRFNRILSNSPIMMFEIRKKFHKEQNSIPRLTNQTFFFNGKVYAQ